MQRERPSDVQLCDWVHLFEYALGKLRLLVPTPADVLRFLEAYCADARFERLRLLPQAQPADR